MNKIGKLTLTLLLILFASLMISTKTYAGTATVTVDTLRVRQAPATDSNIVRNLDMGDTVEIIEKSGNWYKIKYDDKEGYIFAEYVKVNGEVAPTKDNESKPNNTPINNENTNNNGEIKLLKNSNMYILPVLISSPLQAVKEDSVMIAIETINNWTRIECNGITGWVLNKDILNFDKIVYNKKEEPKVEPTTGYVNASSLNVRKEASKTAEILTTLTLNKEVTILEKAGEWCKVETAKGVGYVFAEYISDKKIVTSRSSIKRAATPKAVTGENEQTQATANAEEPAQTGDVASYAKQFKGRKYVYGGSGPSTFDCSGFTMYVYKKFGVNLPHNAVTQANYGAEVSKANLESGDLVIFNNSSNSSIGHAGIYIGGGQFIHAANPSRGVTIDSVNSDYYGKRFVEGRRLV